MATLAVTTALLPAEPLASHMPVLGPFQSPVMMKSTALLTEAGALEGDAAVAMSMKVSSFLQSRCIRDDGDGDSGNNEDMTTMVGVYILRYELHEADGLPVEVHDDDVHVDVEDVVVEATTMILLRPRLRLLLLLLLLSIIHHLSSVGEEVVHRPQLAPCRWSGLV